MPTTSASLSKILGFLNALLLSSVSLKKTCLSRLSRWKWASLASSERSHPVVKTGLRPYSSHKRSASNAYSSSSSSAWIRSLCARSTATALPPAAGGVARCLPALTAELTGVEGRAALVGNDDGATEVGTATAAAAEVLGALELASAPFVARELGDDDDVDPVGVRYVLMSSSDCLTS